MNVCKVGNKQTGDVLTERSNIAFKALELALDVLRFE